MTQLRQEEFFARVNLTGDVRSRARAVVRSQVEGVVVSLLVEEGDAVKAGQAVAVLEGSDQLLEEAAARARLAEAESRLLELLEGTRPEVVAQREAELEAARAREREAQSDLESTGLLAPSLLSQRQAEAFAARAREREAQDNLKRTRELVDQGALPERELITAQADLDATRGDRLKADYVLKSQKTENRRDGLRAEAALARARSERIKAEAALTEALRGPRTEEIAAQRNVVAALTAQFDRANLDLRRTEIETEVNGTVSQRQISPGDRVEVGTAVLTVTSPEVDIFFQVPERLLGEVEPGLKVDLRSNAVEGWQAEGEVKAVVRAAEDRSRRQTIRVSLPQPAQLLPGMSIQGQLKLPTERPYLVVERDALVQSPEGWKIFTVDQEKKAQSHLIELVAEADTLVAIRSQELKAGQEVVKRGAQGLRDGGQVALPQEKTET